MTDKFADILKEWRKRYPNGWVVRSGDKDTIGIQPRLIVDYEQKVKDGTGDNPR